MTGKKRQESEQMSYAKAENQKKTFAGKYNCYNAFMKLKLVDKKNETSNVKSFVFEPEIPVEWSAGQFMVYRLDHENPDIRGKQRFFTISSPPFEKNITITKTPAKNL